MKKIENIMEQNRGLLDSEDPSGGHFERFEQKLRLQNSRLRFRGTLINVARIAAVIIVVVLTAVVIKINQTNNSETNLARIEKSKEINEAEQFYSRMLEAGYENIRSINFPDEAQKNKVLEEISKKDESYTKMEEDLQNNPSNEMAKQAMVNYYETRLEVVNQIIANLKQVLNNNS